VEAEVPVRRLRTLLLLAPAIALAACRGPIDRSCDPAPVPAEFTGDREVSRKVLRAAAKDELVGLAKGEHRDADAEDAAWAMEQRLQEEGFLHAHVEPKIDGCRTLFRVNEGLRAVRGRLCFEGMRGISPKEAFEVYDEPGIGLMGLPPVIYRDDHMTDFDHDLEALYAERGWHRAKVGPHRTTFRAERGFLVATVTVPVVEGPRYCVTAVEATGICVKEEERRPLVGHPFSPRMPRRLAATLRRRLADESHPFATVDVKAEIDDANAGVRLVVTGDPGPFLTVGTVTVEGMERTKASFLRGQVRQCPGRPFRGNALCEDVAALYGSGLFSSVEPHLQQTATDQVDVTVRVREVKSRSIEVFGGYGTYEKLRGGVRFTDDNVLGLARRFTLEGRASFKGWATEASIEDPWTFGRETIASLRGGYEYRVEPFYTLRRIAFEAAIERRFTPKFRIRTGYQLAFDRTSDIAAQIPPEDLQDALDLQTRVGALFARATYDARDNAYLPTKGYLLEGGVRWSASAFGADTEFFETGVRAALFRSLGRVAVLGVGGSLDTRWPLGGLETLPLPYRYFLGGASDVRAYGEDELTPTDANGEGLGGLTAAWGSVELRRQLSGPLHVAVFYDVGVVAPDPLSFDGAFGNGFGAGLRYYLPVGPLRVDVAYNPGDLHAASSRWQVQAWFGFSF
jgi:outer membrane protein assembly factor BamA